eukprot:994569-Rhodomonas_salina.1
MTERIPGCGSAYRDTDAQGSHALVGKYLCPTCERPVNSWIVMGLKEEAELQLPGEFQRTLSLCAYAQYAMSGTDAAQHPSLSVSLGAMSGTNK